ncbi:MAG TPA: hypothetical protein VF590_18470 [Isosphaeraceae bacterium]
MKLLKRMAMRYWDDLPWDGPLGRDDDFRDIERRVLVEAADFSLTHLDDLAIIVLFSVFEAAVRQSVLSEVEREVSSLKHVTLRRAAQDAVERIELGSFFWILESFKGLDADLIEEINQVRRYRNRVAHGKRGVAPPARGNASYLRC